TRKCTWQRPCFSRSFFRLCMDFQRLCFESYNAWGQDAKIKSKFERRKVAFGTAWDASWGICFSAAATEPEKIRKAYLEIMRCFADEIGIHQVADLDHSEPIPKNTR